MSLHNMHAVFLVVYMKRADYKTKTNPAEFSLFIDLCLSGVAHSLLFSLCFSLPLL